LILPHIKARALEGALSATQGSGGDALTITLDNVRAATSREKGEHDISSSHCLFVQAYKQLVDTDSKILRTVREDRVFQVRTSTSITCTFQLLILRNLCHVSLVWLVACISAQWCFVALAASLAAESAAC
jgi:hypothetical protein